MKTRILMLILSATLAGCATSEKKAPTSKYSEPETIVDLDADRPMNISIRRF